MMRCLFAAALMMLSLNANSFAQDWRDTKHSFSFSVGAWPATKDGEALDWGTTYYCDYRPWGIHDIYSDIPALYRGSMKTAGSFSLTYNNRLNRWLRWDVSATYTGFYQNTYTTAGHKKVNNESRHYFYFMTGLSGIWLRSRTVEMYSGFEIGPGFVATNDWYYGENKAFVGGHLNLVGIKIGRGRYYGMAELGYGMKGIVSAGFGIRLNK